MIDIDNLEEYDFIYQYSTWFTLHHSPGMTDSYTRFLNTRHEVERLKLLLVENPDEYIKLKTEYSFLLAKTPSGKANVTPPAKNKRLLWMVFRSLITSLGLVLNFAPYLLAGYFSKKIKDPQFRSSIKYGISLVLFPLWFLVVFIVASIAGGFYTGVTIMLIALLSALVSLKYSQ